MNLDTLRSLQARIRNATGPDREIDLEICKAFGRAPIDAIWDVDENLPPDLAKLYKRGWTTPAYAKRRQEYKRGVAEAFSARLTPDETIARIRSLEHEWDFKNAPPFGLCSTYTDSLDACVALQSEVLPGYRRNSIETQTGEWLLALFGEVHVIEDRHALETHAHLLAIFAAVIAREEAKETEKTA